MTDSAPIPQGADPIPSMACVEAKRLRCSATPNDPDDGNTSSWTAPVPPLDDENLLQEILLRLPPKPSSLPRASFVCMRWHNILSDHKFLKRYRKHHRKPPLLGFFVGNALIENLVFTPVLEPPDRIPSTRFSMPESLNPDKRWIFTSCRHGLAVLVNLLLCKIVVWDPLTGQQRYVTFPPGLDNKWKGCFQATVLCTDAEDGHVPGDCFLNPFKLVLICVGYKEAFGSLYDSVSGLWGNIVSLAITYWARLLVARPSILVRNALWWLTNGGDFLAFDFETQSLGVIEKPADNHVTDNWCFQLLRMEDGGLGLAVLSELTIQFWERKSNFDGVVGWVLLQKAIPLEGMLPQELRSCSNLVLFVGYDDDTNVIVLTTRIGNFMLQLDSMQIRHIVERDKICYDIFYPYTKFLDRRQGSWLEMGGSEPVKT